MRQPNLYLSLVVLAVSVSPALGQRPGSAVQLPTFSHFSVGTTVSIPDRGSTLMGGVNRSASGSSSYRSPLLPFRPFKNSAIGSSQSASSVRASAWIHDFQAMDEYLLNQAPRTVRADNGIQQPFVANRAPLEAKPWAATDGQLPAGPLLTVEAEQQRREAKAETRATEAQTFYVRGQEAEAAGKANVARIYYQMAVRRATGDFQGEVLGRLRSLSREQTDQVVARQQ